MAAPASAAPSRPPVVLLVDDNPDDRELALLALRQLPQPLEVVEARDGLEALEMLGVRGAADASVAGSAPAPLRPAFVLLDVNMPRLDGKHFLRRLRADARGASLPVVVFTTSTAPWDIDECYAAGCNVYLVKPLGAEDLLRMFGDVCRVFLEAAELPSH